MPMVSTPVSSATRTQATRSRLEEQVRDGGRRTLVRMPTSLAAGGMPTHRATYCPCSADLPTEERYTYSCAARSRQDQSQRASQELRGPTQVVGLSGQAALARPCSSGCWSKRVW